MTGKGATVIFILAIILASNASADDATAEAAARITAVVCKFICLGEMTVGAIAALMIILAGLRYVTAGDDAGVRRRVWGWIINAFLGVIIVAVAVSIVNYVASEISAPLNCKCTTEEYLKSPVNTGNTPIAEKKENKEIDPSKRPDLIASGIDTSDSVKEILQGIISPAPPNVIGKATDPPVITRYRFTMQAENAGEKEACKIEAAAYVDGIEACRKTYESCLQAAGSASIECTTDSFGYDKNIKKHIIKAVIDPANKIDEANETNNIIEKTIEEEKLTIKSAEVQDECGHHVEGNKPPVMRFSYGFDSKYECTLSAKGVVKILAGDSIHYYYAYSYDDDGKIVSYEIDFGDGESIKENTTTSDIRAHTYKKAGEYAMEHKIIDDKGDVVCEDVLVVVLPRDLFKSVPEGKNSECKNYKDSGVLPDRFDWRDVGGNNFVTSVKNQRPCSSCWGFSTIATMESVYMIQNWDPTINIDLAEQDLVSCFSGKCTDYGEPDWALQYIEKTGICEESCFPWVKDANCSEKCANPSRIWKVENWANVPATDIQRIKESMVCNGPLITFIGPQGHVVEVIGYDDKSDICRTHYKEEGCWIYKDSVGVITAEHVLGGKEWWHVDGFGYMPYSTHLDEAIEVTGVKPIGESLPKTPKQKDQPPEAVLMLGTSNSQNHLDQRGSLEVLMGDRIYYYYGNSRDPELKPLKYFLDFGDAEHDDSPPKDGPPAYYVYPNDGDFTMTLTVTDIYGNTGTATTKVKVLPPLEKDWVPEGLNDACKEYRKTGALPKSFDWHNVNGKDYMTKVRDQGSCMTCWIFGPIGAVEAAYKIQNKNPDTELDLSEQTILSCMQGAACGTGGYSINVLEYIMDKGIPEENCFTYEVGHTPAMPATPCKDCKTGATVWTIEDYVDLPADNINRLKESLICDGPILASSMALGHDFVISGYDDASAICKSHYGLDGCWIYKDSFGVFSGNKEYSRAEVSIWHENGYAYFPYYALDNDYKPFTDRALINNAYVIKGVKKQ